MVPARSLEKEASIEIYRRQIAAMPVADLRALADSMIVTLHDREQLLSQAIRQISELELKHALIDHDAAARQLQSEQRQQKLGPIASWLRRLLWGDRRRR